VISNWTAAVGGPDANLIDELALVAGTNGVEGESWEATDAAAV